MIFNLLADPTSLPQTAYATAFLVPDNWDDWFSFQTLYHLIVYDESGQRHNIGGVKIGQAGLAARAQSVAQSPEIPSRSPVLLPQFDELPVSYFSLGQAENYYESIQLLSDHLKAVIFRGLRDCAFDLGIFARFAHEEVMRQSLLRHIDVSTVRNRLHRLAHGDAALTEFHFEYSFPANQEAGVPPVLDFHVLPNSHPPSNVHVLIGRNGVGKTRCMKGIARAVCGLVAQNADTGQINYIPDGFMAWSFAGLVSVSFSAFDSFDALNGSASSLRLNYVGLRDFRSGDNGEVFIKSPDDLMRDFCSSFELCRSGPRARRWREAIEALETDPLFEEADVTSILDRSDDSWRPYSEWLFGKLSSGHKIVLLTMTRLVELVDEKTLVLIDEPEGHLHPPLLAAFIRSLNNLLVKRNGVAIIATHSPVVLQEVPRANAWKLMRAGHISTAERPSTETFGENVGILTREVFGLEVTHSGFHQLIADVIHGTDCSYEELLAHFSGQIGAEARAIARALISERTYRQGQH